MIPSHSESEGLDFYLRMVLIGFNWITRQDSCAQVILADCRGNASAIINCSSWMFDRHHDPRTRIETRFRGQSLIRSQQIDLAPISSDAIGVAFLLRDRLHARSVLEISFDMSRSRSCTDRDGLPVILPAYEPPGRRRRRDAERWALSAFQCTVTT
jgi:hypothetical protein